MLWWIIKQNGYYKLHTNLENVGRCNNITLNLMDVRIVNM